MRTPAVLVVAVLIQLLCVGCHTTRHDVTALDGYEWAVTRSAFAVQTLKALDAGEVDKAYRATLLGLKESMLRVQRQVEQKGVPPHEKGALRAVSLYVLSYVETNRERLGADASSDHCALQITSALKDTLTTKEELRRAQALHDYFAGRFVEEREFYE